jgi:hypothetical protein
MTIFSSFRLFLLPLLLVGLLLLGALPGYAADGGVTYAPGPNLNVARMAHVTAVLPGGKVALIGGHGPGFSPSGTADIWDPATNQFTLYNMKYTHDGGAIAKLADGRYLLAGGLSGGGGTGYSTTAEIFDPAGPTFTATTGAMTQARALCAAATLTSGKVLVTGGWYNASAATYGDLFDPASNTFTATGPLNTPRSGNLVLPTSDGKAVVCGGYGPNVSPYAETVELYDPATNTFSLLQGSLLPGEPGWFTFSLSDWNNGRSIDTQRLSDGRYLLAAFNGGSIFILVTFDPATKTFAKYIPTPPLPSSGLAMVYFPAVDLSQGKAYCLTRPNWTAPFPTRNYTLNPASGSLDSPAGTTPLNDCMYAMGMNLLADGRLFLTGGSAGMNNFSALTKTYFATPTETPVENLPPTANAGPDQTVHVGNLVTLDGSASSDPDGNLPLTYAWSFASKPEGSTAAINNPTLVNPTFTLDKEGAYVVQLQVKDSQGAQSGIAYVTISTSNSAPVANAGPDQSVIVTGTTVQLDGRQSYDSDGDPMQYSWTLSVPKGSTAAIANPTSAQPTFVPDVYGDYTATLVVNDPWVAGAPAMVKISFENLKPVANAGHSQSAMVGETVSLDGSASSDANGDPLTYQWSFVSKPAGSQTAISNPSAINASFTPDLPGAYVVQLIVNDGRLNSDPSTAQIQVTQQTGVITLLQNLILEIQGLAVGDFKNANMRNTLINKLNAVIGNVEAGNYQGALGQLQNDILGKTDGCATSGAPDKNDWLINCKAQSKIYPELQVIITTLQAMK